VVGDDAEQRGENHGTIEVGPPRHNIYPVRAADQNGRPLDPLSPNNRDRNLPAFTLFLGPFGRK
jgi:hypothetical protein